MATQPLKPEQQELLDGLKACMLAAPSLRFGQVIRYALEQPNVGRRVEVLPVAQDDDVIRGLASLHRMLTANKPSAPADEQPGE